MLPAQVASQYRSRLGIRQFAHGLAAIRPGQQHPDAAATDGASTRLLDKAKRMSGRISPGVRPGSGRWATSAIVRCRELGSASTCRALSSRCSSMYREGLTPVGRKIRPRCRADTPIASATRPALNPGSARWRATRSRRRAAASVRTRSSTVAWVLIGLAPPRPVTHSARTASRAEARTPRRSPIAR